MTLFEKITSSLSHNSGMKTVSLVIAIVMWVVVLGSRTVEVTKELPLEVVTAPEIVISTDLPEKISFRLAGPKAFLRAILDRKEEPIRVNLAGAKAGLVTYRFFSDNIRLPIGVKVLQISPPSLAIRLEPQRRKEVPVRLELRGEPPAGYQLKRSTVVPNQVRVRGPESKIVTIHEMSTLPIELATLRGKTQFPAQFDLQRQGIQVDGQTPVVTVETVAVEANYRIKNVEVKVNSKLRHKLEQELVTVFVRVNPNELQALDRAKIAATLNLQQKEKGRYYEKVEVTLPPNVGLVRVVPDRVHVTLF